MALYPMLLDVVEGATVVQPLPQVHVLHRLLVRRAPGAALPAVDPFRNALLHVLRIGVDAHPARALQGFERADDRSHLHAIVRGVGLAAPELLLRFRSAAFHPENNAPSSWPGIAAAGAVAVDLHDLLSHVAD